MKTLILFLVCSLALIAALEFFRPFERFIVLTLMCSLLLFAILGGFWLSIFLENRFPQPKELPSDTVGIILLGGSFSRSLTVERGVVCYNRRAGRLLTFLELAQRYPHLRLVFSGAGNLNKVPDIDANESVIARRLFTNLGLDQSRIVYEDQSRNTYENAYFTYKLVQPAKKDTWVLVTSAFHMARSVGLFRKAGWKVLAYPCDYAAPPHYGWGWNLRLSNLLILSARGYKETLGLIYNYLKGSSSTLFPGPLSSEEEASL